MSSYFPRLFLEVSRHVVEPRELDHRVSKPARGRLEVEELRDIDLEGEDEEEEEGPDAEEAAAEEPEGGQSGAQQSRAGRGSAARLSVVRSRAVPAARYLKRIERRNASAWKAR